MRCRTPFREPKDEYVSDDHQDQGGGILPGLATELMTTSSCQPQLRISVCPKAFRLRDRSHNARRAPIVDDAKLPDAATRAMRAYATLRRKADAEDRRLPAPLDAPSAYCERED